MRQSTKAGAFKVISIVLVFFLVQCGEKDSPSVESKTNAETNYGPEDGSSVIMIPGGPFGAPIFIPIPRKQKPQNPQPFPPLPQPGNNGGGSGGSGSGDGSPLPPMPPAPAPAPAPNPAPPAPAPETNPTPAPAPAPAPAPVPPPANTPPTSFSVLNICSNLFNGGSNVLEANGVSLKLFDPSGTERYNLNNANFIQATRKAIIEQKRVAVGLGAIADGFYYMAFCNAAYHSSCRMTADDELRISQLAQATAGGNYTLPNMNSGLLGGVPRFEVRSGALVGAVKGAAFLAVTGGSSNCEFNLSAAP